MGSKMAGLKNSSMGVGSSKTQGVMFRASQTSAATRSGRVTMSALPSGPLSYATKGQLVLREMAHGGKASMKMGTGYYPNPPVGPGKHSKRS